MMWFYIVAYMLFFWFAFISLLTFDRQIIIWCMGFSYVLSEEIMAFETNVSISV